LPELHAFLAVTEEDGEGVVVAVKDNIDVRGFVTTVGSELRPRIPARRDATVVANLRRQGHLIVGKTNLHEWALGHTSANPHFGSVANPRVPGRIPGGSSGGSAAAVAAGLCDWALGTDTGGSIRNPAAFCGVVGLRPSQGLISRRGIFTNSFTFDTVGPMARDVDGVALGLSAMMGRTPGAPVARSLSDLKLAIPEGWVQGLDEPVARAWAKATRGLPEVRLPALMPMFELYDHIALPEAAMIQRQDLESSPDSYGADVRARLMKGLGIPAVDYLYALSKLASLRRQTRRALQGIDALLVPTAPCAAPTLEEALAEPWGPLGRFTRPLSMTGLPVLNLPLPVQGAPIGIQVVGHFGGEHGLLEVARALERSWLASHD